MCIRDRDRWETTVLVEENEDGMSSLLKQEYLPDSVSVYNREPDILKEINNEC